MMTNTQKNNLSEIRQDIRNNVGLIKYYQLLQESSYVEDTLKRNNAEIAVLTEKNRTLSLDREMAAEKISHSESRIETLEMAEKVITGKEKKTLTAAEKLVAELEVLAAQAPELLEEILLKKLAELKK